MASTVTIDKAYFETLLRRAEFHVSGQDLTTPLDLPTVTIPKVDHDNLLRMVQEYSRLTTNLYNAGISKEKVETLIKGPVELAEHGTTSSTVVDQTQSRSTTAFAPSSNFLQNSFSTEWPSRIQASNRISKDRLGQYNRQHGHAQDNASVTSDGERDDRYLPEQARLEKPHYARIEQRTILVKNLSDRSTHKDIVEIIRGGAVLDIYLRLNDRTASVSFVEGTAAQEFLNYAKRNDIYIHGKRAEFAWNDRQFILPSHVGNKITIGASRNLVIRGVHPNITDERIRDDLEHIHNLIIIDISFQNGDTLISLNSVHNSLFARTCMMSRGAYKGTRIEWYPDECAQPLPKMQYLPKKESAALLPKQQNSTVNRFHMLNIDSTEDGSDEDGDDNIVNFSSMRRRANWSPTSVFA